MEHTDLRPTVASNRTWTIRRCQTGYVVTSTSDDYKRTVQDEGLLKTLDGDPGVRERGVGPPDTGPEEVLDPVLGVVEGLQQAFILHSPLVVVRR